MDEGAVTGLGFTLTEITSLLGIEAERQTALAAVSQALKMKASLVLSVGGS